MSSAHARLLVFLATSALWSVTLVMAAGHGRESAEYERVDTFVTQPLGIAGVRPLASLRMLGQVTEEKMGVVANRHDPTQNDEFRTLQFDGMVIDAYFPARDLVHGIMTRIVVTNPKWQLRHGLNVGVAANKVEAVLGIPDKRDTDRMTYFGDTASGTFIIRDNRVIEVVFEGSVD